MKISKHNLAMVSAKTTAFIWVTCSIFVALFPDMSRTITEWWMHGMNVESYAITWESFILGGITISAFFALIGYIFGWLLENNSSTRRYS